MSSRLKLEIFQARNKEWSWRVIRGARIIAVGGETYRTRYGCRRAVKALADICTDKSSSSWVSPLQAAALAGLAAEQQEWAAHHRPQH